MDRRKNVWMEGLTKEGKKEIKNKKKKQKKRIYITKRDKYIVCSKNTFYSVQLRFFLTHPTPDLSDQHQAKTALYRMVSADPIL